MKIIKNPMNVVKAIAYYVLTYFSIYVVFNGLYKILDIRVIKVLNDSKFIYPSYFNFINTGVLFLAGIVVVTVIRLIFYQQFSISNIYFFIILISSILMALNKDFLIAYYIQSTGYGGILLEIILYPFIYVFHFIYQSGLSEYMLPLVLIIFIVYILLMKAFDYIFIKN